MGKPSNNSRGEYGEGAIGVMESPDQLFDGDDHQLRKETDESQSVYPYSASNEPLNSDEFLSSKAPLLSGHPSQYQDATSTPLSWSQQNLEKGDSSDKTRSPDTIKRTRREIIYQSSEKWLLAIFGVTFTIALICCGISFHRMLRGDFNNLLDSSIPFQDEIGSESPFSRDIIVDNGANSIWGKYPLYDLLSLSTASGNIAVSIDPQPADPSDSLKPARVVIRSQSGSVSVSFSSPSAASMPEFQRQIEFDELNQQKDSEALKAFSEKLRAGNHGSDANQIPPSRPYEIDIETVSGSVSGRYIFSTAARIRTLSGSISAQLVPIVSHDPDAPTSNTTNISLSTETDSGSTDIRLTEPYVIRDVSSFTNSEKLPLDTQQERSGSTYTTVSSSHTSNAGSLQISYPQSWAGHVIASSSYGNVWIGGQGIKFEGGGSNWVEALKEPDVDPGDEVWWGSKGAMNVTLKDVGSGAIRFWVGR